MLAEAAAPRRDAAPRLGQQLGEEVVRLMFDNLAQDRRLLPALKRQLKAIEPAVHRLAEQDSRFFSDRNHPARQLLDRITQRSLAFSSEQDAGWRRFLATVEDARRTGSTARWSTPTPSASCWTTCRRSGPARTQALQQRREEAARALLHAEQRNLLAQKLAADSTQRSKAWTWRTSSRDFLELLGPGGGRGAAQLRRRLRRSLRLPRAGRRPDLERAEDHRPARPRAPPGADDPGPAGEAARRPGAHRLPAGTDPALLRQPDHPAPGGRAGRPRRRRPGRRGRRRGRSKSQFSDSGRTRSRCGWTENEAQESGYVAEEPTSRRDVAAPSRRAAPSAGGSRAPSRRSPRAVATGRDLRIGTWVETAWSRASGSGRSSPGPARTPRCSCSPRIGRHGAFDVAPHAGPAARAGPAEGGGRPPVVDEALDQVAQAALKNSLDGKAERLRLRQPGCGIPARQLDPASPMQRSLIPRIIDGFPAALLQITHGPVRLHHEPRRQDRAAEAADPEGHLPVLLPGRQDRRAGPERLGQVDAAEDHGRHRQGVSRAKPRPCRA